MKKILLLNDIKHVRSIKIDQILRRRFSRHYIKVPLNFPSFLPWLHTWFSSTKRKPSVIYFSTVRVYHFYKDRRWVIELLGLRQSLVTFSHLRRRGSTPSFWRSTKDLRKKSCSPRTGKLKTIERLSYLTCLERLILLSFHPLIRVVRIVVNTTFLVVP